MRQIDRHQMNSPTHTKPLTMREIKLQAVRDAIDRHDGDKPAAAAELGIALKSVYNILAAAGEGDYGGAK
jgi:transcriptional regulator with PAS, ATPase and Fis domain